MTELSTAPRDRTHTPGSPVGPWTLSSAVCGLGLLLVAEAPLRGGAVYGWSVIAVTAAIVVRLAIVDELTHTLPNRLTGALAAFGAVQAIGISWLRGEPAPLITAAVTAGLLAGAYALLAFTGSSGFGDIKLAGALALTIALYAGLLTLYLLPIAFIISAARMMIRRLGGREDRHPHGTSLAIAGIVLLVGSMLAGPALLPA